MIAFGIAAVLSAGSNAEKQAPEAAAKGGPSDHAMFGGTDARNMVNLIDKGVPEKVESEGPALLWKAALGNKANGGPTIAGGKVYVGTNNELLATSATSTRTATRSTRGS